MRLKRSYRYSLEELPLRRAKGMRYSSPSSTITSCLCLPTGPLECIKPCQKDRRNSLKMHNYEITFQCAALFYSSILFSLAHNYISRQAMTHRCSTHPLHRRDEQIIKCSQWRLSEVTGATGQGRVTIFGRRHGVTEEAGHTLATPAQTQNNAVVILYMTFIYCRPKAHSFQVHLAHRAFTVSSTNICTDKNFVFFT